MYAGPDGALRALAQKIRRKVAEAAPEDYPLVVKMPWVHRRKLSGYRFSDQDIESNIQFFLQDAARVAFVRTHRLDWSDSPSTYRFVEVGVLPPTKR